MCSILDGEPAIGLVGPRLVYPDGSLQLSARRYPPAHVAGPPPPAARAIPRRRADRAPAPDGRRGALCHGAASSTCSGACQMFSARAQDAAGEIDERFWFGPDDADWCFAIRRAGLDRALRSGSDRGARLPSDLRRLAALAAWPSGICAASPTSSGSGAVSGANCSRKGGPWTSRPPDAGCGVPSHAVGRSLDHHRDRDHRHGDDLPRRRSRAQGLRGELDVVRRRSREVTRRLLRPAVGAIAHEDLRRAHPVRQRRRARGRRAARRPDRERAARQALVPSDHGDPADRADRGGGLRERCRRAGEPLCRALHRLRQHEPQHADAK